MTTEDIISLAEQAGCGYNGTEPMLIGERQISRLIELVQNAERERCAKTCEELFQQTYPYKIYAEAAQDCADAIRSR